MNNIAARFEEIFHKKFGDAPAGAVHAPGRVNLIGEHTDYNDGFVLPMAINFGVSIAGRKRDDKLINVYSIDYDQTAEMNLADKFAASGPRWSQYVEGVLRSFEEELNIELPGFDAVITGDVPQGAGLSSSAAVEVATGFFINELFDLKVSLTDIALLGQKAEHNYLGVMCGIMDQFASALCAPGAALFLDCRSLEYRQTPVDPGDYVFLILNSNKSRGLADSAYNDRRRACEEGVRIFRKFESGVKALRDVTPEMFDKHAGKLPEDVMRKCRHIVHENKRVEEAAGFLGAGELEKFGELMWQSHDSLRDDYEVSCTELDALNEIARGFNGVAGERMTGAGFGGCAVALVRKNKAEEFSATLSEEYRKRTGLEVTVYETVAAGGVKCLSS